LTRLLTTQASAEAASALRHRLTASRATLIASSYSFPNTYAVRIRPSSSSVSKTEAGIENLLGLLPAGRVPAVAHVVPASALLGDVVIERVCGVRRDAEELEHLLVAGATGEYRGGLPRLSGRDHV
jgi:hypothetical protein